MSSIRPASTRRWARLLLGEPQAGLERIGFQPGDVFFHIDAARADDGIEQQWALMHSDLVQGIPSIVCMHYDASPNTTELMRLVVGYEAKSDSVIYLDPSDLVAGYRRMERAGFFLCGRSSTNRRGGF